MSAPCSAREKGNLISQTREEEEDASFLLNSTPNRTVRPPTPSDTLPPGRFLKSAHSQARRKQKKVRRTHAPSFPRNLSPFHAFLNWKRRGVWPEERNGRGERGRAKRLFSSPILPQRKGEESWGRERERSQFWIFLCRKWGGDEEGPFLLWPLSPFLREKGNFLSSSPSPSSLSFSNPTTSSSSFLPPPPALQIDSFNIRLRRCLGKLSPSSPRKIRQTLPYLSIETLTLTHFLGPSPAHLRWRIQAFPPRPK